MTKKELRLILFLVLSKLGIAVVFTPSPCSLQPSDSAFKSLQKHCALR